MNFIKRGFLQRVNTIFYNSEKLFFYNSKVKLITFDSNSTVFHTLYFSQQKPLGCKNMGKWGCRNYKFLKNNVFMFCLDNRKRTKTIKKTAAPPHIYSLETEMYAISWKQKHKSHPVEKFINLAGQDLEKKEKQRTRKNNKENENLTT